MPLPNIFSNLPGVIAQIQDGNLRVSPPQQTQTQSVLLLGVATDGPVNTPIAIPSLAAAERLFGTTVGPSSYTNAQWLSKSLTLRMYEVFNAGCTDIRLVRVGGTASSISLVDSTSGNNLTITANYPGVKYNGLTASVAVSGTNTTVTITTLDGVPHYFSVNSASGQVYGDLIQAINTSPINMTVTQGILGNPLSQVSLSPVGTTAFAGGADGTNMTDAQYSNALAQAYAILEQYPVDVVVPAGAYLQPSYGLTANGSISTAPNANNGDTVFYGQNLAQFCARLSVQTKTCFGVLSVTPLSIPSYPNAVTRSQQLTGVLSSSINATGGYNYTTPPTQYTFQYQSAYASATGSLPGPVLDPTSGLPIDCGFLLNICAGPDIVANHPVLGNYVADMGPSYAGLATSLSAQVSTTNKQITNALALTYQFGGSVLNSLVGLNFVTASLNNGQPTVVADTTYAYAGSDFRNLSTLRISYAVMNAIRASTSQFIGQPNNPANMNSLGTAVKGVLTNFQKVGALIDASFNITATSTQQITGQLQIQLVLIPALEIKQIIVPMQLQAPGAVSVSGTV